MFIDLSNINYKYICNVEHSYDNNIYVIVRSFQNRPPNNYGKLLQSCKLAEGLYMVSVNVIHSACFVMPDIGNVDANIVHCTNSRLSWVGNIWINIYFVEYFAIFTTNYYFISIPQSLFICTVCLFFASKYINVASYQFKHM